jgi:phosphoglucosamine mutase
LINVRVTPGFDWQSNAALIVEKELVEKELAGQGRVLIRASGTEPLIRVMVETSDAEVANNMARRLANCIS